MTAAPVDDPLRAQLERVGGPRVGAPRRVVVLGNVGNGNTGDESLATVVLAGLGAATEVVVLSRDPDRVAADHGVRAVGLTTPAALRAVLRSQSLVVVGGGMFGPGLPPLVRALPWLAAVYRRLGRELAYVGVGVYPGTPPVPLLALRRASRRGLLTVRDQLTVDTLDVAPAPAHVGDLARRLPVAPPDAADAALAAAGVDRSRPLLLLAPKAATTPGRTAQLVSWCTAAARAWTAAGGVVAAVALSDRADHGIPGADADAALVERIGAACGLRLGLVGPGLAPSLAAAVVGRASAVVGLRFHAVVFADLAGVPCLAPPWEPKTAALLAERSLPALRSDEDLAAWLSDVVPPAA